MLHMDIIKERLSREYGIETLFTTPTVAYLVKAKGFTDERFKSGRNGIETITSGLFIHVLGDFASGLSIDSYEEYSDHQLADKFANELKPWLVVRSGSDMITK